MNRLNPSCSAMEHLIQYASQASWPVLILALIVSIGALGKGADWLVDLAVDLSKRSRIPPIIIGATIVSMGTTLPEAVVSVLAATRGNPGLALGNAVGSVIADTGLIMGLSCLLGKIPVPEKTSNIQGWIQLGTGILLVLLCIPYSSLDQTFTVGGTLSQGAGWFLITLLLVYIFATLKWARGQDSDSWESEGEEAPPSIILLSLKLAGSIAVVVGASEILIGSATEVATRLELPESVIASTIVAFGTSLPELVTCITSVRKNQGSLALGNVVGADILNVLFVAGAAASVTPGGLFANPHFFITLFPAMILLLVTFRTGLSLSKGFLGKPFGLILIGVYVAVTLFSYK